MDRLKDDEDNIRIVKINLEDMYANPDFWMVNIKLEHMYAKSVKTHESFWDEASLEAADWDETQLEEDRKKNEKRIERNS